MSFHFECTEKNNIDYKEHTEHTNSCNKWPLLLYFILKFFKIKKILINIYIYIFIFYYGIYILFQFLFAWNNKKINLNLHYNKYFK